MTRATMLAGLAPGRVVECDVRGRVFMATLVARTEDGWQVTPHTGNYHNVSARQIRAANRVWTPQSTQVTKS